MDREEKGFDIPPSDDHWTGRRILRLLVNVMLWALFVLWMLSKMVKI